MKDDLKIPTFEKFQTFLNDKAGLFFAKDKLYILRDKITERTRDLNINTFEEYYSVLQASSPQSRLEFNNLVDILTIGETSFFRNKPQFEVLRNHVIPEFTSKILSASRKRKIKIWTAGCSTGQEPYSIAMTLMEMIPDIGAWDISILATDINRDVIKIARGGNYHERALRGISADIEKKYFVKTHNGYRLIESIRKMVNFENHNLAQDPYTLDTMQNLDILICRNVTIYFKHETIRTIMNKFFNCLKWDGFMFIGHAETLWGISEAFTTIEFANTFIYKKLKGKKPLNKNKERIVPLIQLPKISINHKETLATSQLDAVVEDSKRSIDSYLMAHASVFKKFDQCIDQGDYEAASNEMTLLIKEDDLCAPAYYFLGILETKMNELNNALKLFLKSTYLEPGLSIAYFQMGILHRAKGDIKKSIKEYRNCLKTLSKLDDDDIVTLAGELSVNVIREATQQAINQLEMK